MTEYFAEAQIKSTLTSLRTEKLDDAISAIRDAVQSNQIDDVAILVSDKIYGMGLVVPFDMTTWRESNFGQGDPWLAFPSLSDVDLVRLLSTEMRKDHGFGGGYIEQLMEDGRLAKLLQRISDSLLDRCVTRWAPEVIRAIMRLREESASGKMAYLSITSKPESTIRDAIAWNIQNEVASLDSTLRVAREWRRFDLAMIDTRAEGFVPELVMEIKVCHGFDYITHAPTRQIQWFDSDVEKLRRLRDPSGEEYATKFFLLINTNLMENVNSELIELVKYSKQSNRALALHSGDEVRDLSNSQIFDLLANRYHGEICHATVDFSNYWGIRVVQDFFLLSNPQLKSSPFA